MQFKMLNRDKLSTIFRKQENLASKVVFGDLKLLYSSLCYWRQSFQQTGCFWISF